MKNFYKTFLFFIFTILICVGCEKSTEKNTIKESTTSNLTGDQRIEIVQNSDVVIANFNEPTISNLGCDSKSKNVNYTLKLDSGKVYIINEDTFENYSLDSISDIKSIGSITYTSNCDDAVYFLLTNSGDIYYTNNNIVSIIDIKNIGKEFKKLSSDYSFTSIGIDKTSNEAYSVTNSKDIIKLNFR